MVMKYEIYLLLIDYGVRIISQNATMHTEIAIRGSTR